MRIGKGLMPLGIALALAAGLALTVSAAQVTTNGITLTYPSYPPSGPALLSCEPWEEPTANTISLSGVPDGATVEATFIWANPYTGSPNFLPAVQYANVTGGSLVIPIQYPMDTTMWPVFDATTNERAIAVAVAVRILSAGTTTKLVAKQWWIRCLPPQRPLGGCTPGYWRQEHHFDSWVPTGYMPEDDFESVFGVDASFDPHTMLDAVWLGGGGERALARHAVAALLNAAHPDFGFQFTTAQVIAGVQNAYATGTFEPFKTQLDAANNTGCDLN